MCTVFVSLVESATDGLYPTPLALVADQNKPQSAALLQFILGSNVTLARASVYSQEPVGTESGVNPHPR